MVLIENRTNTIVSAKIERRGMMLFSQSMNSSNFRGEASISWKRYYEYVNVICLLSDGNTFFW